MSLFAFNRRSGSRFAVGLLVAGSAYACGGTEDSPRPEPPDGEFDAGTVDLSSCESIVDAYEFTRVESFEEGSVDDKGTTDPAGWWVSSDGTNEGNYVPFDNTLKPGTVGCQTTDTENCRDLLPREGGAPSLVASVDGATDWTGVERCETTDHAMMLKATAPGFGDWGLSFGSNFHGALTDASDWDGVAFWARRDEDSAVTTFTTAFADNHTSNQAQTHECRDGLDVANLCDPFGRGIAAEPEWKLYVLPFADLKQQGFGAASPLGALDVENILGMSFQVGPGTWEIWVDEIVYYRER